jgi:hypothetical protein
MFCSTCGADSQNVKSYCKRCGEWLPDLKAGSRLAFGGETPQQNIFSGLFMSALSAFAALFSAIALYATYLGTSDAKWSIYVAAAFCLCIAGWQASSFVIGLKLRRRLKQGREAPAVAEFKTHQEAPSLNEADFNSIVKTPSVAEGTTRELQPSRLAGRDTQR